MFDRSWYNRAGVERVMGFCTPDQHAEFIRQAPLFEQMLVNDGISLTKLYPRQPRTAGTIGQRTAGMSLWSFTSGSNTPRAIHT